MCRMNVWQISYVWKCESASCLLLDVSTAFLLFWYALWHTFPKFPCLLESRWFQPMGEASWKLQCGREGEARTSISLSLISPFSPNSSRGHISSMVPGPLNKILLWILLPLDIQRFKVPRLWQKHLSPLSYQAWGKSNFLMLLCLVTSLSPDWHL